VPELIVTLGDNLLNKYLFEKDLMTIGRGRDNDIVIANLAVSRNHAQIRRNDSTFQLVDLNSTNGTYVNGVRVASVDLQSGDVIMVGKHVLLFKNVLPAEKATVDVDDEEHTVYVTREPVGFLVVLKGKMKDVQFRLDKAEVAIGRGGDCEVCLHDWFASKQHAVVHRRGSSFLLRDSGSWRGTKVNDVQVTETVLNSGDEIQIGSTRLAFRLAEESRLHMEPRQPATPVGAEAEAGLEAEARVAVPAGEPEGEDEDEDEPVAAGSEMDYIEPSPKPEPVNLAAAEASELLFPELNEDLRGSAEAIESAAQRSSSVDESFDDLDDVIEQDLARGPMKTPLPEPIHSRRQVRPESLDEVSEAPAKEFLASILGASAAEPPAVPAGAPIDWAEVRGETPTGFLVDELSAAPSAPAAEESVSPAAEVPDKMEAVAPGIAAAPSAASPEEPRETEETAASEEILAAVEAIVAAPPESAETASPDEDTAVVPPPSVFPSPGPAAEEPPVAVEAAAETPGPAGDRVYTPKQLAEIAMWEKALRNKSSLIQKMARQMLKKLTGQDYD